MHTPRRLVVTGHVPSLSFSGGVLVEEAAGSRILRESAAWGFLATVLGFCLWRGLLSVQGVDYPPDEDLIRDVGFIQTILNGNFLGDPIYPGEARWYPPLAAMLGAAGAWMSGQPAAIFWVQAGPWLGLLPVLAVFLTARQVFGPTAAGITTTLFAVVNPAISRPWMTGGYSPWPFASTIGLALFCFGLCVILRANRLRWREALVVGAVSGVALLDHPMPALVLSACAAAAAVAFGGLRARTIVWLAIVAAVEIAVSLILFLPLILHYGMQIRNTAPGAWMDWSLALQFLPWTLRLLLPGLLAIVAIRTMSRGSLSPHVAAVLAAWIIPCSATLARHYGCAASGLQGAICAPSSIPPNHALLYLVLAGSFLLGHAGAIVWQGWLQRSHPGEPWRRLGLASVALLLAFGLEVWQVQRAGAYDQTFDPVGKLRASGEKMDLALYLWLLRDPIPDAVFVTETSGSAAWAVYAAAQPLLGASATHANPYVDVAPREAIRQRVLASLTTSTQFCRERDAVAYYVILEHRRMPSTGQAEVVYRTEQHAVMRLRDGSCLDQGAAG